MADKSVSDNKFTQNGSPEVDNTPIEDKIQHLVGYITDLERNTNWVINYESGNDLTLELVSLAKIIERFHQIKERILGDELSALGEPVWKILIPLTIATGEGKNITAADILSRIPLPKTTALRYISLLESNGYISPSPDQADERDRQLHLTKQGRSIMRDMLLALDSF